jgi:hypothetical protein
MYLGERNCGLANGSDGRTQSLRSQTQTLNPDARRLPTKKTYDHDQYGNETFQRACLLS